MKRKEHIIYTDLAKGNNTSLAFVATEKDSIKLFDALRQCYKHPSDGFTLECEGVIIKESKAQR